MAFPLSVSAGIYTENLKYDWKRGFKNILTSPLEIPISIQDYHERSGWPVARQGIGGIVGAGKMLLRLGSGLVDLPVGLTPGLQKGLPVKPEKLF